MFIVSFVAFCLIVENMFFCICICICVCICIYIYDFIAVFSDIYQDILRILFFHKAANYYLFLYPESCVYAKLTAFTCFED